MLARLGLWLLPRLAWVTFLVIILVWAILVEGGFGFDESSVFGWHALFMTLGFGRWRSAFSFQVVGLVQNDSVPAQFS
jgi:hypothetical protein